jgi:hypothetical protein
LAAFYARIVYCFHIISGSAMSTEIEKRFRSRVEILKTGNFAC